MGRTPSNSNKAAGSDVAKVRRTQAERTAASTEAIREAALWCFNEKGFQTTSMDEVAASAGVSKGLVLYHFASKERLLVAVLRSLYTRVSEDITAATAGRTPSLDQAELALDRLWTLVRASRPLMPLVFDLVAQSLTKRRIKKQVTPLYEELRQMLIEGIDLALGPNVRALGMSSERLAELTLGMILGLWSSALITDQVSRADQGFADFKRLLLSEGRRV